MSDLEQVSSFNPLIILIWVLELLILAMDYSADKTVTWSIPVIGSFLLVQLYMVWKTNYDQMMKEQREAQAQKMSSVVRDTPLIIPGKTNLTEANQPQTLVDLTLSPSIDQEKE